MEKLLIAIALAGATLTGAKAKNNPQIVILKNGNKTQVMEYGKFKKYFKEVINKFKPTIICFK
jgi:hypothetical protein